MKVRELPADLGVAECRAEVSETRGRLAVSAPSGVLGKVPFNARRH